MNNFEIVDFYPLKRDKGELSGTVHVYFPDLGLDLRGLLYVQKKDFVHLKFPQGWGLDSDKMERVSYPIWNLTDSEAHMALLMKIREAVKVYVGALPSAFWVKWAPALEKIKKGKKPIAKKGYNAKKGPSTYKKPGVYRAKFS